MPEPSVAIVCGSSECPTCGRTTEALFGPCVDCMDHFSRTGTFPRRKRRPATPLGPERSDG